MKKHILTNLVPVLPLLLAGAAWQQAPAQESLDHSWPDSRNHFGLSYRMGFNLDVQFKNLGGFLAQTTPLDPSAGGFVNRTYDDGYNRLDSNGNIYPGYPPATRNYSYSSAGQVQGIPPSIVMHSSSSAADVNSGHLDDDPVPGVELTYNRELFRKGSWRWGLETALSYSDLTVDHNSTYLAGVTTINDAFEVPPDPILGTRTVPSPGISIDGPATPLIDSTPTRSITTLAPGDPGSASIAGQYHFHADLLGFRLGPSVEFPLSRKVAVGASAGFALVYVNSDFHFNESVTIPGVGTVGNQGSGSKSDWLPGGYVAGNVSYALSDRWALAAGAQFQDVGRYTQVVHGKEATLDLSRAIFVTLGITYSF